jgi:hypothetical protein
VPSLQKKSQFCVNSDRYFNDTSEKFKQFIEQNYTFFVSCYKNVTVGRVTYEWDGGNQCTMLKIHTVNSIIIGMSGGLGINFKLYKIFPMGYKIHKLESG